jgi:hypothetical protein
MEEIDAQFWTESLKIPGRGVLGWIELAEDRVQC